MTKRLPWHFIIITSYLIKVKNFYSESEQICSWRREQSRPKECYAQKNVKGSLRWCRTCYTSTGAAMALGENTISAAQQCPEEHLRQRRRTERRKEEEGAKSINVAHRNPQEGASLGMGLGWTHAQVETRTPSMAVVGRTGMLVSIPAERNIE